jgi:hypothetical protein
VACQNWIHLDHVNEIKNTSDRRTERARRIVSSCFSGPLISTKQ